MEDSGQSPPPLSGPGKFPKILIPLLIFGLLSFGGLVLLLRMPKDTSPVTLPLLANHSTIYTKDRKTCRSRACLDTAQSLLSSMNTTAIPCTNFFNYACGNWIKSNPVPPNVSKWSHFGKLDLKTNKMIQSILSSPQTPTDHLSLTQAKEFYKACSDINELDRVGLQPVQDLIFSYGGMPLLSNFNTSAFDWMRSMADLKRMFGTSALFDIQVNKNILQPHFSQIYIAQPSLFLGRPYLLDQRGFPGHVQAYLEFIINIVKELQAKSGHKLDMILVESQARELINFESKIASLTRDGVTLQYGLRNSTATVTLRHLQNIFANYTLLNATTELDIKKLLELTFKTSEIKILDSQLMSVGDVNFIGNIFELITTTKLETLANYIHFRMLGWIVSGTTKRMRGLVEKYQRVVYGLSGASDREFVCASSTEEKFGLALARGWIEKIPGGVGSVGEVVSMFEEIRTSFLELLDSSTWMNVSVKSLLRKKALSIRACVGFAPWMLPNSNLARYHQELDQHFRGLELGIGTGYLDKLLRVRTWLTDEKFNDLRRPHVPGCKWTTFPGQIGAFYDLRRMTVNIPLGVLQQPFFFPQDVPAWLLYGALGSIMGHELTHGFTVRGWTEKEDGSFTKIGKCFSDQYDKYKLDGAKVNGALTFDENFPDNGGINVAFKAADKLRKGYALPGLEHLTDQQLFFLGFANIWCSSSVPQGLRDQLLQDHHTPNEYRVVGALQNSREFAEAWNCPSGSFMNPREKCPVF